MEKFDKLLAKKMKDKKSEMGDTERDAKMSVLQHVKDMAQDMMKGRLQDGMKKVTVASDSKEGLEDGLQKAKDMMTAREEGKEEEATGDEEGPEHESQESPDYEAAEHGETMKSHDGLEMEAIKPKGLDIEPMEEGEDLDESQLDAKLSHLMKLKERMQAKKRL